MSERREVAKVREPDVAVGESATRRLKKVLTGAPLIRAAEAAKKSKIYWNGMK